MLDRFLAWIVFAVAVLAVLVVHAGVRELDRTTGERMLAVGELHALRHEARLAGMADESLRASVVEYLNAQLARTHTSPLGAQVRFGLLNSVGGPRVVLVAAVGSDFDPRPVGAPR